jgi:hypothetical protein
MTHQELKNKALARQNVRAEYDALESEFALLKQSLTHPNSSAESTQQKHYVHVKTPSHFGELQNV